MPSPIASSRWTAKTTITTVLPSALQETPDRSGPGRSCRSPTKVGAWPKVEVCQAEPDDIERRHDDHAQDQDVDRRKKRHEKGHSRLAQRVLRLPSSDRACRPLLPRSNPRSRHPAPVSRRGR